MEELQELQSELPIDPLSLSTIPRINYNKLYNPTNQHPNTEERRRHTKMTRTTPIKNKPQRTSSSTGNSKNLGKNELSGHWMPQQRVHTRKKLYYSISHAL